MATASDNFTRANSGTLGANWTQIATFPGQPQVLSNAWGDGGFFISCGSYWSADAFGGDQFSNATLLSTTNASRFGAIVRCQTGVQSFYFGGYYDTSEYMIGLYNATTFSLLATTTQTATVNDVIELDIVGNKLSLLVNGSEILTVNDSTLTGGSPGLWSNDLSGTGSAVVFDIWSGGDIILNPTFSLYANVGII